MLKCCAWHYNTGLDLESIVKDGVIGGIGGLFGGSGVGTKALNSLGTQTVKRATTTLTNQGIKAAAKETKKAISYYTKSAGYVYGNLGKSILSSNIPSAAYTVYD